MAPACRGPFVTPRKRVAAITELANQVVDCPFRSTLIVREITPEVHQHGRKSCPNVPSACPHRARSCESGPTPGRRSGVMTERGAAPPSVQDGDAVIKSLPERSGDEAQG